MIVLNDIELVMPLRSLGLLRNGMLGISQLYLTDSYLEINEKLAIKELGKQESLIIFDMSNDFYNFYNKWYEKNPNIGITDISSVYYAKELNHPLISKCKYVQEFAKKNGVRISEPIEALKEIKAKPKQVDMLKYLMTNRVIMS